MAEPGQANQEGNFFQRLFGIKPKTEAVAPVTAQQAPEKIVLSPFAQANTEIKAQVANGPQVEVVTPETKTEQSGIDAAATNQALIRQNFGNGADENGGAFGSGEPVGKVIDEPKNPLTPKDGS